MLATLTASCFRKVSTPEVAAASRASAEAVSANSGWPPARGSLFCSPQVLGPHDTLRLAMSLPHGDYLVVRPPGGIDFMIAHPDTVRFSLWRHAGPLSAPLFAGLAQLSIAVDTLRAWPSVTGHDTTERVFRDSGDYQLFVAAMWETLRQYDVRRCVLRYGGS